MSQITVHDDPGTGLIPPTKMVPRIQPERPIRLKEISMTNPQVRKYHRILMVVLIVIIMMGFSTSMGRPNVATAAPSAAMGSGDFLKTNGTVIRKNSGSGAIVNLRGTNLGGWLLQEGWMSPAGEAALNRS